MSPPATARIPRRWRVASALLPSVVVASLFALASPGCNIHVCDIGAQRCNGDELQICAEMPAPNRNVDNTTWRHQDNCAVACVTEPSTGRGGCRTSPVPVPECAHARIACVHGAVVYCDGSGYPFGDVPCASGQTCLDTPECGAMCVVGGAHDPSCTATTSTTCEGVAGTMVGCKCGYRISTGIDCGPGLCQTTVTSGQSTAFCSLSVTREPACRLGVTDVVCKGSTLIECNNGFEIHRTECPGACHAYGGVGACN